MVLLFFHKVICRIGWSKFCKSAQIMPPRLYVAYFWQTWRKELEFWALPSNWVCPTHMKICCLCSKGQKFNVMDFDKNLSVPLFWCGIYIFEAIYDNIYPRNWKKLRFVIFAFSYYCILLVKLYMGGAHSIWGRGPKFKFLSSSLSKVCNI